MGADFQSSFFPRHRHPFLISLGCGKTPGLCVSRPQLGFDRASGSALSSSLGSFPLHRDSWAVARVTDNESRNCHSFIHMGARNVGKPTYRELLLTEITPKGRQAGSPGIGYFSPRRCRCRGLCGAATRRAVAARERESAPSPVNQHVVDRDSSASGWWKQIPRSKEGGGESRRAY